MHRVMLFALAIVSLAGCTSDDEPTSTFLPTDLVDGEENLDGATFTAWSFSSRQTLLDRSGQPFDAIVYNITNQPHGTQLAIDNDTNQPVMFLFPEALRAQYIHASEFSIMQLLPFALMPLAGTELAVGASTTYNFIGGTYTAHRPAHDALVVDVPIETATGEALMSFSIEYQLDGSIIPASYRILADGAATPRTIISASGPRIPLSSANQQTDAGAPTRPGYFPASEDLAWNLQDALTMARAAEPEIDSFFEENHPIYPIQILYEQRLPAADDPLERWSYIWRVWLTSPTQRLDMLLVQTDARALPDGPLPTEGAVADHALSQTRQDLPEFTHSFVSFDHAITACFGSQDGAFKVTFGNDEDPPIAILKEGGQIQYAPGASFTCDGYHLVDLGVPKLSAQDGLWTLIMLPK